MLSDHSAINQVSVAKEIKETMQKWKLNNKFKQLSGHRKR